MTPTDTQGFESTEPPLDVSTPDAGAASWLTRNGLTPWDAGAVIAAVLLVVAFVPAAFFESWSPRMSIILAVGPVGLHLLGRLCRRADKAAVVLAFALLWTVVSAIVSDGPRSALFGYVGRDLSALTIIASAAFWPLGIVVSDRGRRVLLEAVVWAAASSALVGILQALASLDSGPLALLAGRPTGFATNPVFLGAISATGLAMSVLLAAREGATRCLVATVPLGIAVTMSGSRVAMLGAVLMLAGVAMTSRTRPATVATAMGAASLFVGVFVDRWVGAGRNAADRLIDAGSGTDGRTEVWGFGLDAWAERPLIGYGFGRFRPAVQGRFTSTFVRDYAPDDVTQAWFDAHNVGVGLLVAVGLIGVLLFVAWVVLAARLRHAWVAWALLPLVVHWGLQPVTLYTLPLAMLLYGVARGSPPDPEPLLRRSRVTDALVAGGLVLGCTLITVDVLFQQAADDVDTERLEALSNFFGGDPIVADVVAQAHSVSSSSATPTADE
ncbi:O-antigen ligase family protein, partial [Ilumatobacter sp.]|uniref:O-antigen ligase family protein n=1 Tax=Ilumatobacter sp. TaxID=1967498 RepID=UPI003AF7C4BA